jgi:hypothetical protein
MKKLFLIFAIILLFPCFTLADTTYYVDPTFTGGSNTGSATNPWTTIGASQWTTINTALASGAVYIYMSARQVGSDTAESMAGQFTISRTNQSTNMLTFDGKSKWNTNDTTGSWSDYTGTNKFRIYTDDTNYAVYVGPSSADVNYFKLYGLFLDSPSAEMAYLCYGTGGHGCNYEYIDNCNASSSIQHYYASTTEGCTGGLGRNHDIYITNNSIDGGGMECIYVGGVNSYDCDGHYNVYVTGNTVTNCGGEGDGIDIKDGSSDYEVSGNTVHDIIGYGITTHAAGIIEKNKIYNVGQDGIRVTSYWGKRSFSDDLVIRNNVTYGNTGVGIRVVQETEAFASNIYIYNNSTYNDGISKAGNTGTVTLKNNVGGISGTVCSTSGTGAVTATNNDWFGTSSSCGTIDSNGNVNVDPLFTSSTNLTLQSGSPLRTTNYGVNLYSVGVVDDILGTARPSSGNMTMGAYEYNSGTGSTSSPRGATIGSGNKTMRSGSGNKTMRLQ